MKLLPDLCNGTLFCHSEMKQNCKLDLKTTKKKNCTLICAYISRICPVFRSPGRLRDLYVGM